MKIKFAQTLAITLAMAATTATYGQDNEKTRHLDQFQQPVGRIAPDEPTFYSGYSEQLGAHVREYRRHGGQTRGMEILSVDRGSAAENWGFEKGDVILRLDGYRTASVENLDLAYRFSGPEFKIEYINVRNGRYESSRVRKESMPPAPPAPPELENSLAKRLGMRVRELPNFELEVLQVGHGLAWQMGLKQGDVITGIASVGMPVYPGRPAQDGAILRELRVYRPYLGSFQIDASQYGTIIY